MYSVCFICWMFVERSNEMGVDGWMDEIESD